MVSSTTPGNSDSGPPNPSSTTTAVKLLLAAGDDDGDGRSNLDEQNAGTNPLDASSLFKILFIQHTSPAVSVGFTSVVGKTYQLETSTSLDSGTWTPVGSSSVATSAQSSLTNPTGGNDPKRFYRVRVIGT